MLTPLDIHNKEFKKSLRGYDVDDVDDFLDEVIEGYEMLYKENMSFKEELERYKENLSRYKEIEETLHSSLVLAQQTADEVKKSATKEAALILENSRQESKALIKGSQDKLEELNSEYDYLKKNISQFKAQVKGLVVTLFDIMDIDYDLPARNKENLLKYETKKEEIS